MHKMTVSIVIPVYNEEESLGACLQAIAAQTVKPWEVIVVDNNSTDNSVAVARQFPFVTVINEPRQGVVHARTAGFNAARGAIIGRIDADSLLAAGWVARLQQLFASDRELSAVTGRVRYYNLAWSRLLDAVDFRIRKRLARLMGREVAIQGANMAIRRSAWRSVYQQLCAGSLLHEDYDLAIHLSQAGHQVLFDEKLLADISFRQAQTTWRGFSLYALVSPRTYALHGLKSRRHMYPVVALVIICYPLLKLLHKGYDPETRHFSWGLLLEPPANARVNPATFVD